MSLYVGTAVEHEESERCNGRHCHSCDLDEDGYAYRWCYECGHGYERPEDLVYMYLAEAPYGKWHWRWWRILLFPSYAIDKLISFCPLCLHDFLPEEGPDAAPTTG